MPVRSVEPSTGTPFGPAFQETTDHQLDLYLAGAVRAFEEWSQRPAENRAACLSACAEALERRAPSLADLADRETALGAPRLLGEIARSALQFRVFADALKAGRHLRTTIDLPSAAPPPMGHPDLRRSFLPIGVVAVFAASNFPFAFSVVGGDTASALAAGCPILVKAHPGHPQTSHACWLLLRDALRESGAPANLVNLVHGVAAGRALLQDDRVDAAAFTGSTSGGRALADIAAARPRPIPFYGELGSVNPVVILASRLAGVEDVQSVATGYVDSLTLGGGQFCTNPGLLIVPSGSGLVAAAAAEVSRRRPEPMLNEHTLTTLRTRVGELLGHSGARVVAEAPAPAHGGYSFAPMLVELPLDTVRARPEVIDIECFGPVGTIVETAGDAEVDELLSHVRGALVGCVHGAPDDSRLPGLVRRLAQRTGRVVFNGWPTGVAVSSAQNHGGPYPASTNPLFTSVGTASIDRFLRPVAYQDVPTPALPAELRG